MTTQSENEVLYRELTDAAYARATAPVLGSIIGRAYAVEWETGDIYEALNEGGLSFAFGLIEALGQKYAGTQ